MGDAEGVRWGGGCTGVARFADERHEGVFVQFARLVVVDFEDRGASHGGFGGDDDGAVFAGDAEEDLPGFSG